MASILDALLNRIQGVRESAGANERALTSGQPPPINPLNANPQLPQIPPEIKANVLNFLTLSMSY